MKIMDKKKEKIEFVRVIVGKVETGQSGVRKPIKSISLEDTTVKEVFDKIKKMLENEK